MRRTVFWVVIALGFWGCEDDNSSEQAGGDTASVAGIPGTADRVIQAAGITVDSGETPCGGPGLPACMMTGGQQEGAGNPSINDNTIAGRISPGTSAGGQVYIGGQSAMAGQRQTAGQAVSAGLATSVGGAPVGGQEVLGGETTGDMAGAAGRSMVAGQSGSGGQADPGLCDHSRSQCGGNTGLNCPAGWTCMPLPNAVGAPCSCIPADPVPVRAMCPPPGDPNRANIGCCDNADCGQSVCQQADHTRRNQYCGGIAPEERNECVAHECFNDADCNADQACIPAGALGFVLNSCVNVPCRIDADCTDRPGGECRPLAMTCGEMAFVCTYANDACRSTTDCRQGECIPNPNGQGTVCEMWEPPPAAPPPPADER